MSITLDILIPTYNRCDFLKKNLNVLSEIISKNNLAGVVKVLVSNNNSDDDTCDVINYVGSDHIVSYNQKKNIGLEENVLFLIGESTADYIMYLGDDDYVSSGYLLNAVNCLMQDRSIKLIVPSFYPVNFSGDIIGKGRDVDVGEKIYEAGFESALYFSWRAHQMSGLCFFRDGLIENYREKMVCNLYPFIFFAAVSAFSGKSIHMTNYPLSVTQVTNENKDWSYGGDGLLDDVFNNFNSLEISWIQRVALEQSFLRKNKSRVVNSFSENKMLFIKLVLRSKNTSIATKLSYIPIIVYFALKKML